MNYIPFVNRICCWWRRLQAERFLANATKAQREVICRDLEAIRRYLMAAFAQAMRTNRRGMVEDFSPDRFDAGSRFVRIGGGSLGGKARGLAFVDALLVLPGASARFWSNRIGVVTLVSALLGVAGMTLGFFLTICLGFVSPGPMIVLTLCILFGISYIFRSLRLRACRRRQG